MLARVPDLGVRHLAADETLDGVDRLGGIRDGLALGDLADESFAVLREAHDRGRRTGTLAVRDDLGRANLDDGDARICRAEIDAENLTQLAPPRSSLYVRIGPRRGDFHAGRPQKPVVEQVPLLENLEDRARRGGVRLLAHDGLMNVRVERDVPRRHLLDPVLAERVGQLPRDHVDARVELFSGGVRTMGDGALEVVDDAEDVGEHLGEREPEVLCLLLLGSALHVFEVRGLPKQGLANAARLLFGAERAFVLARDLILEERETRVRPGRFRGHGLGHGDVYGYEARRFALAMPFLDGLDGALGLAESTSDVVAAVSLEEDDVLFLVPRLLRTAQAAPSVRRRLTYRESSSTSGTTRAYSIRRGPITPRAPSTRSPQRYGAETTALPVSSVKGLSEPMTTASRSDATQSVRRLTSRAFSSKARNMRRRASRSLRNSGFSSSDSVPSM